MWDRGNDYSNDVKKVKVYAYRMRVKQFFAVGLIAGNIVELEEDDTPFPVSISA